MPRLKKPTVGRGAASSCSTYSATASSRGRPGRRGRPKASSGRSTTTTTTTASALATKRTDQLALLDELKGQLEAVSKQVHHYRHYVQAVDKLRLNVKPVQRLRRRCRIRTITARLTALYELLYELQESCGSFAAKRRGRPPKSRKSSNSVKSIEASTSSSAMFTCFLEGCAKRYKREETLARHMNSYHKGHLGTTCGEVIEVKCEIDGVGEMNSSSNNNNNNNSSLGDFEDGFEDDHYDDDHDDEDDDIDVDNNDDEDDDDDDYYFEDPQERTRRGRRKPAASNHTVQNGVKRKRKNRKKADPSVWQCDEVGCDYTSRFKSAMEIHKVKHTDARPFLCESCGKCFKNLYALRSHSAIHQGKTFECPMEGCSAKYSWYYTLRKHLRLHYNEAPVHRCDWPGCDYQTHRPDLLRKHRTRHTGERKYPCTWPDCGKAFKTESGLFDHLSMHKNERKHACTWAGCSYRCNLPGNLRKHVATHQKKLAKSTAAAAAAAAASMSASGCGVVHPGDHTPMIPATITHASPSQPPPPPGHMSTLMPSHLQLHPQINMLDINLYP